MFTSEVRPDIASCLPWTSAGQGRVVQQVVLRRVLLSILASESLDHGCTARRILCAPSACETVLRACCWPVSRCVCKISQLLVASCVPLACLACYLSTRHRPDLLQIYERHSFALPANLQSLHNSQTTYHIHPAIRNPSSRTYPPWTNSKAPSTTSPAAAATTTMKTTNKAAAANRSQAEVVSSLASVTK